jgi:hypothetical protein
MCLITDLTLRNSGNDEITCYKVLNKGTYVDFENKCTRTIFSTPIQGTRIDNDIILGKKAFKAEGGSGNLKIVEGIDRNYPYPHTYEASGGFIHTFADLDQARYVVHKRRRDRGRRTNPQVVLCECIIPKNTLYAVGKNKWNDDSKDKMNTLDCYASRRIKFVKEIEV